MSKLKKAMDRSKVIRAQMQATTAVGNQAGTATAVRNRAGAATLRHPAESETARLQREQLEKDIRRLLRSEHPDELTSAQKQIKLSYTKTKKIKTDPEVLKNNGIFAIFPDTDITKQIEILRAQVLKKLKEMNANSVMVTSANHREGKTFMSTNLAVSIAQNLDRTVMLVDADLRNRSYKHNSMANVFFNSNTRIGLSDYLSGDTKIEDMLINPGIARLTIMPSGKTRPDSASLLGSPKMEELTHEMKAKYGNERILLFDCCSILSNADPFALSRYVDAVLLVVESERTNIKDYKRMIKLLKDNTIIGTVLNKTI